MRSRRRLVMRGLFVTFDMVCLLLIHIIDVKRRSESYCHEPMNILYARQNISVLKMHIDGGTVGQLSGNNCVTPTLGFSSFYTIKILSRQASFWFSICVK